MNAFLTTLPSLRAEESMLMANRVAVGSGTLTEESRTAITREWALTLNAGQPRRTVAQATPEALRALGIDVMRVPGSAPVEEAR